MSDSVEFVFDIDISDFASSCLLSQCTGCRECQNNDFLSTATQIEGLKIEVEEKQKEIRRLKRQLQDSCAHHLVVRQGRESCARCGVDRERPPPHDEGWKKCINKDCPHDAEVGICPKHLRPKLACSVACYKIWKSTTQQV
jgi:hypothetical protein